MQIKQAVDRRDPEFWAALTSDDLAHLKALCQRSWVNRIVSLSPWRLYLWVAVAVAAISLLTQALAGTIAGQSLPGALVSSAICGALSSVVVTALLCLSVVALISLFKLDGPTATLAKLQPVRNAEHYAKHALAYVSNSPSAQDYRDRVLAQGREMCVIDFEILLKLARMDAY